ncbi:hypothetical protein J3D56_004007 [Erwinia persicina]|nr:hypothetical protein [Erwinia persicina]
MKNNRYRLTLRYSYWNELCALACRVFSNAARLRF